MAAAWPLASDARPHGPWVLSLHVSERSIRALVLDAVSLEVIGAVKVPLAPSSQAWLLAIVAGLDAVLVELRSTGIDLSQVRAIAGSAPCSLSNGQCVGWLTPEAKPVLASLDASLCLGEQLGPQCLVGSARLDDLATLSCAVHLERSMGRAEYAERTGHKLALRLFALHVMREIASTADFLHHIARICTPASLVASILVGRVAALGEGDAAATGLWSVRGRDWDDTVLHEVAGGDAARQHALRARLGPVSEDPTEPLGRISAFVSQRFGLPAGPSAPSHTADRADCVVLPFFNDLAATCLVTALDTRAMIVGLGWNRGDFVLSSAASFAPAPDRIIAPHPADPFRFVVIDELKDAALARTFAQQRHAESSWLIYGHRIAVTPIGGSLSPDDKLFSFFVPYGDDTTQRPSSGLVRFSAGQRVLSFASDNVDARVVLESTLLSMRAHLSTAGHHDRPGHVILVGGASASAHIAEVVADVFGAPVYALAPDLSAASLGAAHLAAWSLARRDNDRLSFEAFLGQRRSASTLQLVAEPDLHSTEQYTACLPEHCRLARAVDRGWL